jgi:hypothetical protein
MEGEFKCDSRWDVTRVLVSVIIDDFDVKREIRSTRKLPSCWKLEGPDFLVDLAPLPRSFI